MPRRGYRLNGAQRRARDADRALADEQAALANALTYTETTADLYVELSQHRWSHVRGAIAGNPTTPPELLDDLSRDAWEWNRATVARNPNAPESALLRLARDKRSDHHLLLSVARNPARTPAVMQALSSRRTGTAVRVAADPLTPLPVLRRYARSKTPEIAASALSNPAYPDSARRLESADEAVLHALLNPNRGIYWGDLDPTPLPDDVLDVIERRLPEFDAILLRRIAMHGQTRTATLDWIAAALDYDDSSLALVAKHPNASEDLLRTLAMHPAKTVRTAATSNPNCPDDAAVAEALLR